MMMDLSYHLKRVAWVVGALLFLFLIIKISSLPTKTINQDVEKTDDVQSVFETEPITDGSQWSGKKWVAFGTSITATNNSLAPDGTSTGKYTPYLMDLSGLELTNRGVAGACMSGHILYYVNYYIAEQRKADLITIEGSVNDFAANVPLGAVGDTVPYQKSGGLEIGGTNEGTFAGACYQVFKNVKINAPNAVIIYLTENTGRSIASTGAHYNRDAKNGLGLTQDDYINMAVAVAENMGITVIDAGALSLIDEDHAEYLIDHIHHSESGGQRYAEVIWDELKEIENGQS